MRSCITVCNGCPNRAVGCHSNCQAYLKEKMKHDIEKQKVYDAAAHESHFIKRAIIHNKEIAKKKCGKRLGQK